jgi:hypothetical protein
MNNARKMNRQKQQQQQTTIKVSSKTFRNNVFD